MAINDETMISLSDFHIRSTEGRLHMYISYMYNSLLGGLL